MALWTARFALAAPLALAPAIARGADALTVLEVALDRPTLHALGVQVLIADDDDRDARVEVRVREPGGVWRAAPPLLRVWPETVFVAVPQQFAGSVFDLDPGTEYEIELRYVDPDGPIDMTEVVTASTRPIPRADPQAPVDVPVQDVAGLHAALAAAQPGHVIRLASGTYPGAFFTLNESGTASDPIVIRGDSQQDVVLDGQGCDGCNVLEVYGSHVHIEDLTIRAGTRAIRFLGVGATGNVVRRVTIADVVHGIGSTTDQADFYLCDNDITGRLVWPWTFAPDAVDHWDDRGVDVTGDGHVVCHNRIVGFGDPVVNKKVQARAWDVVGNDIADSYDGTELDEGEGNVRLYLNRFTNVMDPVSIQPSHGGPAYVLRNVVLNAPEEPIKLKSLGGIQEPSGVLVYHNTFVSPNLALNLQAPITQHNFVIANNLFIGPDVLAGARTVDWTAVLDGGLFDPNGYYPDGGFWFGVVDGMNQLWPDFAAVMAAGVVETGGRLLARPIFAADFVGPADMMAHQEPADFALAPGSGAVDGGKVLVGIDDLHVGAAPDLGARETGCPAPIYGPRPTGQQGVIARINCQEDTGGETTGGETTDGGTTGGTTGGATTQVPTEAGSDVTASASTGTTVSTGADTEDDFETGDLSPEDIPGCGCTGAPRPADAWPALLLMSLWTRRRQAAARS